MVAEICGGQISADDLEDAKKQSIKMLREIFGPFEECNHSDYPCWFQNAHPDRKLYKSFLIEASQVFDIGESYKQWFESEKNSHKIELDKMQEGKGRTEYERLAVKFVKE